nr:MAG TPA: hypothetical protein [Caudoviricetes sp.]
MEIVSGRTGKPHVTSQQFRQLIEGTVGQESCILTSGENLEPELASNNSLKIRSGMLAHHGNISSVKIGTYDAVNLSNGSQGMKRIDLVVCRYTRNAETEVESCNWVVIMGTPVSSNPVAPTYTVGNLQEGDLVDDCPVFEVHYDGINVTEVKKMLSVLPNVAELNSNKIGNKDNLISMLVANAKKVEDCLTQTTESGVYRWYSAKNQPSTGGYMIVFKYHGGASMRLALTDSGAYYSTYKAGVTYGSWEKL